MYYPFIRKALLQFGLERAHEATFQQLRHVTGTPLEMLVRQEVPAKPITCTGLIFKDPLGLAVGLNKDGECIDALGMMGFGSIKIGTVTPRPQPGSDKPRIFRLVDAEGLINRMGFNNHGVDNLAENVKKAHSDGVLGVDIGKNKDMPAEHGRDDYSIYMEKVYPYVGHIAVNISPPNTPGLHTLQHGEVLNDLLSGIKNRQLELQQKHQKHAPIAVKIVPDLLPEELVQVTDSLMRRNIGEVIAANTTFDRSLVQEMKHCDETGELNGYPLQLKSTGIICMLSVGLNGRLPITGAGGIDSVIAAREKIAVGVLPVQIYSGFIFKDPLLIKETVTHT